MLHQNKSLKPGNIQSNDLIQKPLARNSYTIIVGSHYKMGKRIGKGNFGDVRLGKDIKTKKDVAIKTESTTVKFPQLIIEHKMYKILGATNTTHTMEGIPKVYYYGLAGRQYNALVMELLGPSLEELFNICNRKFNLKTVLMIGIHTLHRIEIVHNKGLVYRDIKPENFVIGRNSLKKENLIHIIDFGLAKEYIDHVTKKHIPYREKKNLTEQSRRDDLEALGYMYMYFARGNLPWQGLKVSSKERFHKIGEKKRNTPISNLCEGYPEMAEYIQYVRKLEFYEQPDYDFLRNIFIAGLIKNKWVDDRNFDWLDKLKPSSSDWLSHTKFTNILS